MSSASASFLSADGGGGTPRGTPGPNKSATAKDEDDDQDEIVGAEADDAEAEFIRSVCEKEVVSSGTAGNHLHLPRRVAIPPATPATTDPSPGS